MLVHSDGLHSTDNIRRPISSVNQRDDQQEAAVIFVYIGPPDVNEELQQVDGYTMYVCTYVQQQHIA
ncbi:hypothetical protein OUZ56_008542 [Daphnia magna]|uniref:Uncharacterized protein n=1 Tax=Daphnia magna TaxID=35525 RepID=A0ABR0ADP2_9CRUS|nr:hypothetical protein OUZ56_008542 [Daphnia magna]